MTVADSPWWPRHISPALKAASVCQEDWSHTTDVVVVGFGGAGVCAALQARELGLEVLVLERGEGGGATRINGGVFYSGGGTATQRQAGVEDDPDNMFNYLRQETQGVVSDDTLRTFCNNSAGDHDWLASHGVKFNPHLYAKKTSYPPTKYYLYHSDSSLAQSYGRNARPAARGHRVHMPAENKADGYGKGFYDPLRDSALGAGVEVHTHALVRSLILDDQGRAVGVRATRLAPAAPGWRRYVKLNQRIALNAGIPQSVPGARARERLVEKLRDQVVALLDAEGELLKVRARRGVILAAGGHVFNREMVRHFSPAYARGLPLGTPADDGSGLALGLTAGAASAGLGRISAWRFINPPYTWASAPLVNGRGERFVDETLYGAAIGKAMCEAGDGSAYVILDRRLMKQARKEAAAEGVLPFQKWPALMAMRLGRKKAGSLAGLARKIGADASTLVGSVETHNAVAQGRMADPFDKRPADAARVEQGPFYAVNVAIDAAFFPLPTLSLGGLAVREETGQVLDQQGVPIAGLYAAGRSAIGVCSNLYVSGLAVADCVFSGRRAARSVAAAGS